MSVWVDEMEWYGMVYDETKRNREIMEQSRMDEKSEGPLIMWRSVYSWLLPIQQSSTWSDTVCLRACVCAGELDSVVTNRQADRQTECSTYSFRWMVRLVSSRHSNPFHSILFHSVSLHFLFHGGWSRKRIPFSIMSDLYPLPSSFPSSLPSNTCILP